MSENLKIYTLLCQIEWGYENIHLSKMTKSCHELQSSKILTYAFKCLVQEWVNNYNINHSSQRKILGYLSSIILQK